MQDLLTRPQEEALWTKNFVLICIINLFIFTGFQMLLPTIPVYVEKLGGQESMAGLVMGAFTISAMLIRPWAGNAIDSLGRKPIFFFGLVIFILSVLAYIWAPSVLILLLLRFIHGFGWGSSSTAAGTIAADLIPKSRLGEGMGYYSLTSTLAMAMAPSIGLYLISQKGFTTMFMVSATLVFTALLLANFLTYRPLETKAKTQGALFEPAAFLPSLMIFFCTMTYGSIVSFIALYAREQGITNIGPFFTVYALTIAISRPLGGIIVDRRGFNVVVIPGLILVILTMLILSQASGLPTFLLAASLYGMGFGTLHSTLQAMAIKGLPPNRRGAANGTFFSAFDLGIGGGSILWGVVAQQWGYSTMYLWVALPALIALTIYVANMYGKRAEIQEEK